MSRRDAGHAAATAAAVVVDETRHGLLAAHADLRRAIADAPDVWRDGFTAGLDVVDHYLGSLHGELVREVSHDAR